MTLGLNIFFIQSNFLCVCFEFKKWTALKSLINGITPIDIVLVLSMHLLEIILTRLH